MKNYISQFFGPAGQTTKNISFRFISDQRISKKTYDLVEEGGGVLCDWRPAAGSPETRIGFYCVDTL